MSEAPLCPLCRKTRLSRYNDDPLCAVCTRAAREPGPGTPGWLFDSAPLRRALANDNIPQFLMIFRAASGLSQHDLAAITGRAQSTISLIESGKRGTFNNTRAFLRFTDSVGIPREALLPLVLGRTDAKLAEDDESDREETAVDVDRRRFGGLAAGAAAAIALPEAAIPSRVTAAHIRYLQASLDSLWSRDQEVGGALLFRSALLHWQRARQMLDESSYTDRIGRELLIVAANLTVCAGFLAFDGGNMPQARHLFSEALLLAGNAGDPVLTAHALTNQSMLSSYTARVSGQQGSAREGLRLACQAAEEARHEPMPRLHALIALRHANAASLLGDKPAFRSAITRARRELDRGPSADDPQWIRFVEEAEITGHEAYGHLNLGDSARGEELYRSVLESELPPRNRAYYGALLAGGLLRQGARKDAVTEGMAVLPALTTGVASVRSLNELRPVRIVAGKAGEEEFCVRFDAAERALAV
jgi:transcriptional regulator with XRE-family HTH domain